MPGTFSKTARPSRPGAYFDWSALPVTTVQPNIGSVVLVPIVHDWGPANVPVPTSSLADFQAKFGPTQDEGYAAVMQAYVGEGVAGRGGAGQVVAYRMASTAAKAATVAVPSALTLTAKYSGSYGNNLGWRNTANSADQANSSDFQITLNDAPVETYTYLNGKFTSLAAQINALSGWVTASAATDGTALPVTGAVTPLAPGDDGSLLVTGDWTAMMTACSTTRFSLFAPYNLIDPTILTSIQAWAVNANLAGRRFLTVVGGGLNDTIQAAVTRSQALGTVPTGAPQAAAENFVNLGVGTLVDEALGTLSTAQLAPRVAGILAARGETMSLTFARLAGCTAGVMAADSDILTAFNAGVVVFGQDSNVDAPIRVEKGLTTYVGGDATKPYLIYRNPKFVRTMHGIELEITDWSTANAIGSLQVNDATRAYIVGHAHEVIQARATLGVIQQGYSVGVDPSPPPSDEDEFIALVYGIAFGRSVEQIFNLVYIS